MTSMKNWQEILRQSVTTFADLQKHLNCDNNVLEDVIATFPMRINPYFLELIQKHGAPLSRQAVPNILEIQDTVGISDPLDEDNLSPVNNLVHKYPDRALFLVTNRCAMYCRFCTRKRKVGTEKMRITAKSLEDCYLYLRATPQIREVLISGGDPLLLEDDKLEDILRRLREIPSIEVLRIGTRVPGTLPMRITKQLVDMLKRYHPLYINTHFNHPLEITAEAKTACNLLADGGIPLGNHTVLLKGINDSSEILRRLFLNLLKIRVKPYYLFQTDLTCGTNHFRTPTAKGIAIMRDLIGHISGMAIPTFALDAPGGKGKIPLTPEYIINHGSDLSFTNYTGEICHYPEPVDTF
ncbi:KamA family radical SAM protein [Desulfopila inferna]|uniref:KamA family radical SAM protein n=1 Tax=Desulfopila inferna TaxID=468528 RepID=UPI0027D3445A|nr:KamA family radical SAM protein [Desulfopila inferna]